jgi:hypothetical protein
LADRRFSGEEGWRLPYIHLQQRGCRQQYLHRARQFRKAAEKLPDYSNGEQCWPKYALLTHAIELALKALDYHSSASKNAAVKRKPSNHDLVGWYQLAISHGLTDNPQIATSVALLNELHQDHYTRYPKSKAVPDASIIADQTVDYLIDGLTPIVNPR